MHLIVWLGNPGKEYVHTRHNVGFMMLDKFCTQQKIDSRRNDKSFNADIIKDGDTVYAKPLTYMNRSGESIKKIADFYKIPVENVLVLHDEIDIPTGKIQKKVGGSAAGHNGLKSTLLRFGQLNTFTRIRIGVDRPALKEQVVNWVLGDFSHTEMEHINAQYPTIEKMIHEFLQSDDKEKTSS